MSSGLQQLLAAVSSGQRDANAQTRTSLGVKLWELAAWQTVGGAQQKDGSSEDEDSDPGCHCSCGPQRCPPPQWTVLDQHFLFQALLPGWPRDKVPPVRGKWTAHRLPFLLAGNQV